MTLDQALDIATQLSMKQQKQLINILRHRHIEKRREDIAQHARESMAMVQSGQLKPQPFPDILKELWAP